MQQSLQDVYDRFWIVPRVEWKAAVSTPAPNAGGFFRGLTLGLAMMVPIWGLAIWLMLRLIGLA